MNNRLVICIITSLKDGEKIPILYDSLHISYKGCVSFHFIPFIKVDRYPIRTRCLPTAHAAYSLTKILYC